MRCSSSGLAAGQLRDDVGIRPAHGRTVRDDVEALHAGRVAVSDLNDLDTSALDWAAHVMQEAKKLLKADKI